MKIAVLLLYSRSRTLKMDELQKESNLKRYQYLPPRDRYRLQKQMKADEEAERIK